MGSVGSVLLYAYQVYLWSTFDVPGSLFYIYFLNWTSPLWEADIIIILHYTAGETKF